MPLETGFVIFPEFNGIISERIKILKDAAQFERDAAACTERNAVLASVIPAAINLVSDPTGSAVEQFGELRSEVERLLAGVQAQKSEVDRLAEENSELDQKASSAKQTLVLLVLLAIVVVVILAAVALNNMH